MIVETGVESVPPSVKLPAEVTVPVRVKPAVEPVPPTLVTVPTALEVPAPIAVLKFTSLKAVIVLSALIRKKLIAPGLVKLIRPLPTVVGIRDEFLISLPVAPLNTANALSVAEAGPITAPSRLV